MTLHSYTKQVRAVLLIEAALLLIAFAVAFGFWGSICDGGLSACLAEGPIARPLSFLLLATIRPFVFSPVGLIAIIGGRAFGPLMGAALTTLGSTISCLAVFGIAKFAGKRLAKPWLRANLPATFNFIRSQDYKIVFASRLIPIIPFDLVSFLGGALDFRTLSVVAATLIGTLPEAYMYAKLVDPTESVLASTVVSLSVFAGAVIIPLLVFELVSRRQGRGMWPSLKAMSQELHAEVKRSNDIVRRQTFSPDQAPVLLLYGFFSSRRAVTVLERMLVARGHQVLSFNLGGLLGTFFTRDIIETASFIDMKIKRQVERHGFQKIQIVAHSKGGLVALWWILKLGGYRYCDKVITMGTPFYGTLLTYLALITPLGLIWRDVGQMRPGSSFLRSLKRSEVPDNVHIHCLHSLKDGVARGKQGIFVPDRPSPNIHAWALDHISHFEFLYRRDVGEAISQLLKDEPCALAETSLASAPVAPKQEEREGA